MIKNFIEVLKDTYAAFIFSFKMHCGSDGCKMFQRVKHINTVARYNDWRKNNVI
jgi:hypothetical protein